MAVPPVTTEYHRYCPLVPPAALKLNMVPEHPEVLVIVGGVGNEVIVAVIKVRVLSQKPL